MQRILLVGSSPTAITKELLRHLALEGHTYVVLEDERTAASVKGPRGARWFVCNFSSRKSILEATKHLPPVDGVMTLYENYIVPCAWISEHLELKGMAGTTALACTDKFLMRQAFAKSPQPISPDFALATSEAVVRDFASEHAFPLILKPANLVKSLLVTKSNSLDELLHNYQQTVETIGSTYAKYAPNRRPAIVIEEFLQGSLHSVVGFADQAGQPHIVDHIVDLARAQDAGYDDNFLYCRSLPSSLSDVDQESLRQCARLGIEALDMKNSAAHVEIILTGQGPRIVEIGARLGGYRDRMYHLAYGINLLSAAVDTALGVSPMLTAQKNEHCAVFEFFPKNPGTFVGITGADILPSLASYAYLSTPTPQGRYVGRAAEGYKRCAFLVLHNADPVQFAKDIEVVKERVSIETA